MHATSVWVKSRRDKAPTPKSAVDVDGLGEGEDGNRLQGWRKTWQTDVSVAAATFRGNRYPRLLAGALPHDCELAESEVLTVEAIGVVSLGNGLCRMGGVVLEPA